MSARLSHARTSTTLNVYAHAIPGGDSFAAEVLGGILEKLATHRLGPRTSTSWQRLTAFAETATLTSLEWRSCDPHLVGVRVTLRVMGK